MTDREEILDLIAFYEARGWDWRGAVSYLTAKSLSWWPERRMWKRVTP